ncbi:MAG: hypothetical protein ACRYFX_02740 [Janthinobacterium lividum]
MPLLPLQANRLSATGRTTARLVGLAVMLGLLGLPALSWAVLQDGGTSLVALLVALFLAYLAWRVTLEYTTGRYTLTATSLVWSSRQTHQEIRLADVSGYRLANGSLRIYSIYIDEPYIQLGTSSAADLTQLRDWFAAHYPNLDTGQQPAPALLAAPAEVTEATAPAPLTEAVVLAANSDLAEQKFYLPVSWVGKHLVPWLIYLPASGILGYAWLQGPYALLAHLGFVLAELALLWLLRAILTDKTVICCTVGWEGVTLQDHEGIKTLIFSEIKGFREQTTHYRGSTETYTVIEPQSPATAALRITSLFVDYQQLRELLATRVPDLDVAERERYQQALAATTAKLLQDPRLGPDTKARERVLWRANSLAIWLNLAAIPLALWALLYPAPYELVLALNLGLALLAAGATWGYRGVLQFMSFAEAPRLSVVLAVLLPGLALVFQTLVRLSFLAWAPLWPAAGAGALAFALLLFGGNWPSFRRSQSPAWAVPLALAAAASYGLAAAIAYNGAFGGNGTATYAPSVTGKYRSTGKGSHFYVYVTPWGPANTPSRLVVGRDTYQHHQVGDTLLVRLHHGRLGADWFGAVEDE